MIASTVSLAVSVALFALVAAISLAPIESMSWWAGWNEDDTDELPPAPQTPSAQAAPARLFVVYLSGVSSISGDHLAYQEARFIDALRASEPDAVIISDIFPYAPSGLPLLGAARRFDRFWRRALLTRKNTRGVFAALANFRNFAQVLVSADHRYGPIFNLGVSEVIVDALEARGYVRGSGVPVTIIGFSGGAQVGLGASAYLRPALGAPIDLIALGGVMASDPGLDAVRSVRQFVGGRDRLQKVGAVIFPERWSVFRHSLWNKARKDGKIEKQIIGAMTHHGPKGYFGLAPDADARAFADHTLSAVIQALHARAPRGAPAIGDAPPAIRRSPDEAAASPENTPSA